MNWKIYHPLSDPKMSKQKCLNRWIQFVQEIRQIHKKKGKNLSWKESLSKAKPMYKTLKMKGGTNCMCDIEKVYQILKRECQCDVSHINRNAVKQFMSPVPTKTPPPGNKNMQKSESILFNMNHPELISWLNKSGLKVFAKAFAAWIDPMIDGKYLWSACQDNKCYEFQKFLKDKTKGTRLQRLKLVREIKKKR